MDFEENDLQYPTVTHRLFQLITTMSDDERRTLLKLLENGLLEGRCRREFFRKNLRIPVTYAVGERAYHNYLKDISLGGVFIFTHSAFEAGHRIIMSFGSKDNTRTVKLIGKVAVVYNDNPARFGGVISTDRGRYWGISHKWV